MRITSEPGQSCIYVFTLHCNLCNSVESVGGACSFTKVRGETFKLCAWLTLKLHMVHGPKFDLPDDRRCGGLEKGGGTLTPIGFWLSVKISLYPHDTDVLSFRRISLKHTRQPETDLKGQNSRHIVYDQIQGEH